MKLYYLSPSFKAVADVFAVAVKLKNPNRVGILKLESTMSESCIFCKIVREEAPANVVYEDEKVIAFMSIQPINVGHTLVVPKKHHENIYEIPEDEVAYLYRIVKKLAHAVKKAVNPEGIRIIQNNGAAAGQVIFHLHVHIIPLSQGHHGVHYPVDRGLDELKDDAQKIRQFI
ncbi:HIT family protein [Candidatus Bathyarchaeota archaeon]|nr:HIT family protein [Candidatus Bathyarchaeota archaeon]